MLQFFLHGLSTGSVYALLALGFALIYRSTGIFHVTHGAVYAAAAYVAYFGHTHLALPWPLTVFLAILAGTGVNLACDHFVYRPLAARESSSLVLTLASFGSYLVFSNLLAVLAGTEPRILRGTVDSRIEFAGYVLTRTEVLGLSIGFASVAAVIGTIRLTSMGLRLNAFAQDEELFSVLGHNPLTPRYQLFFLSSTLAAMAGLLVGLDRGLTPNMGLGAVLTAGICVLLGGARLKGVVLAALGIGVLQHFVTWTLSSEWQDAVTFGLLLALAALRPKALLSARGPARGL